MTCLASVVLATVGTTGCDSSPRAPALRDTPVYQNNREGFRFLVPDNWTQIASGVLPDSLEGEVLLVQYRMRTAGKGASLEVLCFDEDKPSNLHKYHAGPSHGHKEWTSIREPEKVTINGTSGNRYVYKVAVDKDEMIKEVVSFRRGKRVYSFIGLLWVGDTKAREQLHRAVESTIWQD